ncbi:MAG: hypothetical protein ABIE36_01330 [Candidatus Diapherotrites archaeon]
MAGTCKYCGANTWGRYRICPDCRKERKRKGNRFVGSGYSSSGGRYVCKSCNYHWTSKKSFGSPAICPNCKSDDIVDYTTTDEYKKDQAIKFFIIITIITGFFLFIYLSGKHYDAERENQRANSPEELIEKAQEECLSAGSFYYSQNCIPIDSIKNHKNLCNSDGLKPIIFLMNFEASWDCYKGKIESIQLSDSQEIEVTNCANLGGVPIITDIVNCVQLETSTGTEKNTISPEQELINFCISQFSSASIFDIEKTSYLEDFSSASEWIRNNYENSALTQEQLEININYITNNQLPKQDYPIVITYGSKKDGQMTSQGFYYCNEQGVI